MKVVNLEILGRPVNILIVLLMIAVFWLAFYALASGKTALSGLTVPRVAGGENNGTVS